MEVRAEDLGTTARVAAGGRIRGDARVRGGWRFPLLRVLMLTGLLAVLQLTTSFYMLVVYDQALPSGSVTVLAVLTGGALVLHAVFAGLDLARARLVCRAGLDFAQTLDRHVLSVFEAKGDAVCGALLDDVERVRRCLTGAGPCAAFDVLWLPALVVAVFLLHPTLGLFAFAVTLLLGRLAFAATRRARAAESEIACARLHRAALVRDLAAAERCSGDRARRAEIARRWRHLSRFHAETTFACGERALAVAAFGKGLRLMLVTAGFGLGALLAIKGALSPGALVASSLLLGRIFVILDAALGHWRSLTVARESYARIIATDLRS